MPIFKYRVRDKSGNPIVGTIDAPNILGAGDQLYASGYFPISIEETEEALSISLSDLWRRFQKVRIEELILFSQQFSALYKAGLPLLAGLESITEQVKNQIFRNILQMSHPKW